MVANVMAQTALAKASGVKLAPKDSTPAAVAPILAAANSTDRPPMMDRRIHGMGIPRMGAKVKNPIVVAIEGKMATEIDERIAA